ncbi:MAG: TolC family protein [Aquificae bacterium]|nr:TolC family protein [Aquificota bacterium]
MHIWLYLAIFLFSTVFGKEIFTEEKIKEFLTQENPYIYTIIGKKYVYQGKRKYYEGFFDTKISGKYERKDYPLSTGNFASFFLEKPTFSGIDFLLGYRRATGVQEYNNIKTSQDGELQIGFKIPFFQLRNNIDQRRLNLFLTDIQIKQIDYQFQNKLRELYLKIISSYYKTIYYKHILSIEEELLQKAKQRQNFIQKRVKTGILPKIYEIEAQQQIINREQRVLKARNDLETSLNEFLKYLNISKKEFAQRFQLPFFPELPQINISIKEAKQIALENRPDLITLNLERERLKKEKMYYSLLKYPKFIISIYGVHDFRYNEGYKLTLDATYPIERRKYIGKSIEIRKQLYLIEKKFQKILLELQTNLNNIFQTTKILKENIKNSKKEIELVTKLEEIEKKKFKLGAGTLFLINQREIYTLETKKKYLKYILEYLITYKKLLIELNLF